VGREKQVQEEELLGEEERDKGMEEEGKSWEAVAIAMSALVKSVFALGGKQQQKLWFRLLVSLLLRSLSISSSALQLESTS
jgi:hypothetical protein